MVTRREMLLGCGSALAFLASGRAVAADGKVYRVPISLQSSRLLVSCTIEGKGPFALGIDTGGLVSVISQDVADQLKLRHHGWVPLDVAGRAHRFPMFEAREIVFGDAFRQAQVLFAGVNLQLGRDVAGMLAAGCLTTMDSELDFSSMQWRLYPDGAPARDGWIAHPDAIEENIVGSPHLFGRATMAAQQLRCLFDTGAPGPISLKPAAAQRVGIATETQNWSPAAANGHYVRLYRSLRPMEVGGLTIDRPLIRVNDDLPEFVADGIVGLPVIQRLNMATDVKARRMWTRPSGLPAVPEEYNRSGLWIDRKGDGIVAGRVGKGSPAERAGIAAGDRLDGFGFSEMIARLNGRIGQQVALKVSRGGQQRDVTLVLEDYL